MNKAGFTTHTLVPGIFLADKWEFISDVSHVPAILIMLMNHESTKKKEKFPIFV